MSSPTEVLLPQEILSTFNEVNTAGEHYEASALHFGRCWLAQQRWTFG